MTGKREPKQKRGKSVQVVGTPPELLDAVRKRFGLLSWDLAANASNAVVPDGYFGPGSLWPDSLAETWDRLQGNLWLNPEYTNIKPWAKKAAEYRGLGTVLMLVPASVGSTWFADHVHGKALVLALRPRVTFVGHTQPFPKDLVLCVYAPHDPRIKPGFDLWQWRQSARVLASSMPRRARHAGPGAL